MRARNDPCHLVIGQMTRGVAKLVLPKPLLQGVIHFIKVHNSQLDDFYTYFSLKNLHFGHQEGRDAHAIEAERYTFRYSSPV